MLRFCGTMVIYTAQQVVQLMYRKMIKSVCDMAINCHTVYKHLNKGS